MYLSDEDRQILRNEPPYVRKRYRAVSRTLAPDLVRITREDAANLIHKSKRQMQRIVKRFKEEGIPGLRFRSKRPHTTPKNKTPPDIERRVIELRKATGFGSEQLARIVNEGLDLERRRDLITDTTCYNILARNDLVAAERRVTERYKSFEWGHPDELVQCDLTEFNGFPILTMLDDHSREGWAGRIEDATDDMVVEGMTYLHPHVFENLLTDNGKQFARMNSTMRKYCERYVTDKHIWSTIHHPQTLGKLSAYQKGMKRFLIHRLGRSVDVEAMDECIRIYAHWHNNGLKVRTTKCYPEERYSGKRDSRWYERLVKALKLEWILPIPADGG